MKFLNNILEGNKDVKFKKYIATIFKWKFLITFLKSEFLNYYLKKYDISETKIMEYSYDNLILLEK